MIPEHIKKAAEDWDEKSVKKTIGKFPERSGQFQTVSGEPVDRLYLPDSSVCEEYNQTLGFPGQYPFTRGVQPTMYRGRLWTMRQYAGFSTAEESNRRYRYLLAQGSTGLSVAFDLPTQIGLDSDNEMCIGEVGKVGVAIDTLADMEALFHDIPLDRVSTSMTINAPASVLLAMYVAVGQKQGASADKLTGTIQNDVLKEYVARGTYIFPLSRVCASSRISSSTAAGKCPNGTRFRSAATISGRRVPLPPRRSDSRWPTRSATSKQPCGRGFPWTISPRA